MNDIYVQFSDAQGTAIDSYFCCPQDPSVYPNLGTVQANDSRWKTFYDSAGSFMQSFLPAPASS
jgi:hypothetical protein